jgi:hypothetical protein
LRGTKQSYFKIFECGFGSFYIKKCHFELPSFLNEGILEKEKQKE